MSLRCVPRSLVHSVQFSSVQVIHHPPSFPSKSKSKPNPLSRAPTAQRASIFFSFPIPSNPIPCQCRVHAMQCSSAPRRAAPCRKDCGTPGPAQNRFRSDSKTTVERNEISKGNREMRVMMLVKMGGKKARVGAENMVVSMSHVRCPWRRACRRLSVSRTASRFAGGGGCPCTFSFFLPLVPLVLLVLLPPVVSAVLNSPPHRQRTSSG
jgi:hypothetical protein